MVGPHSFCGFRVCGPFFGPLGKTSSLLSDSADGLTVMSLYGRRCGLFCTVASHRTHNSLSVRHRRCVHGSCRCVAMVFLSQATLFPTSLWISKGQQGASGSGRVHRNPFGVLGGTSLVAISCSTTASRAQLLFVFSKRALVYGCDDVGECFVPTSGFNRGLRRPSSRVLAHHRDEQTAVRTGSLGS